MKLFASILLLLAASFSTAVEAEPMTFEIGPGTPDCQVCIVVTADGEITRSTPALFRKFVDNNQLSFPKKITRVMNSPGGSLMGGLELGQLIRSSGFNTHVGRAVTGSDGTVGLEDGICASACAYAFLGGSRRSIGLGSKYGLHQISTSSRETVTLEDAVGSTQDVIAQISKYVEKMGASTEVVTIATQTRSKTIDWVEGPKLSALKIVNSPGLNFQESWKPNFYLTDWSVWSTASDGSRVLFLLRCQEYFDKGYVQLSTHHYRPLPKDHNYYKKYTKYPVHLRLNEASVASFEETVSFDSDGVSIRLTKLPIFWFKKAIQSDERISVKVDYPTDFVSLVEMQGYLLPVNGFEYAVTEMSKQCPHLAEDDEEKWKKKSSDEGWSFSQRTQSGNLNDFKISCSYYNKGWIFISLSHNYGDLASKTRTKQGVDRESQTHLIVASGGKPLFRSKDGKVSDSPWSTTVFGLKVPAAKLLQSAQRIEPVTVGWGPDPALLEAFGAAQLSLPQNGLEEALAQLRVKCSNAYN